MTITIKHTTEDTLHPSLVAQILHYVAHDLEYTAPANERHTLSTTRTVHMRGAGTIEYTLNR